MNIAQFLKSLIGRPLACGIIAILAVAAAAFGWQTSSQSYQSTAVAVVIPPGSGNPDAMMNPLIRLDNEVAHLAALVATTLRIDGAQAARSAGGTGDFTVDTTFGDSSRDAQLTSQLVIVARGPDPASAQRGAAALVEVSNAALTRMQASLLAQPGNGATILTAVDPQPGVPVGASPVRRAVSYGLAAVAAGVILLLLFDAMTQQLRKLRREPMEGRRRGDGRTGVMPHAALVSEPLPDDLTINRVNTGPSR